MSNEHLYSLLSRLLKNLNQRQQEYFITHVRSHQALPGLSEGNARADRLVATVLPMPNSDKFQQAKTSHEFLHQSPKMLVRQFGIPLTDASGIVQSCPVNEMAFV